MELTFEWDEEKDLSNQRKHGVSFDEAKTVFGDPRSITIADEQHSDDEDRYIDIGISSRGRLIVVSYTKREPNIRIISCRKATRSERKTYEQAN
ncbi:MAG: BrnT family toxin [Pirellulales bacterium]